MGHGSSLRFAPSLPHNNMGRANGRLVEPTGDGHEYPEIKLDALSDDQLDVVSGGDMADLFAQAKQNAMANALENAQKARGK